MIVKWYNYIQLFDTTSDIEEYRMEREIQFLNWDYHQHIHKLRKVEWNEKYNFLTGTIMNIYTNLERWQGQVQLYK
ncbi:hypothetical protein AQUCO_00700942v1 [Aquilegia coerulea]|uniref:Uncharacterized protein n=1 Tax=Aquilegia coerulea TaxID=218851 RepID=A0A2G5EMG2_AQUCA|nr:hypothetical protein AQUCO_00700942v1 [Aquilegia coerulea]